MTSQDMLKGGTIRQWRSTNDYGDTANNGNLRKQWTETGAATYGVNYAYDFANRIRAAAENPANESQVGIAPCSTVGGNWCVTYGIDGFGNAWTENKSATARGLFAASSNAYNQLNRLAAAGFYANGNQKHWLPNNAQSRAEYDGEGHLTRAGYVTTDNGLTWDPTRQSVTYTYNGMGQRVKQARTQGSTTVSTHYVYGIDGELAADYETPTQAGVGRQYLIGDQLGSTRVRLDANGDVVQRIDYEPYELEIDRTGVAGYTAANDVKQKYTGKERDSETGLDYFGARYLSGAQGRFTSPDTPLVYSRPDNPQTWNLYSYVGNNPLTIVDLDGHCGVDWNCWGQFGSGFADTTYRPIVQAVSNPVQTAQNLANAVTHPIETAVAVKNAVVETTTAALSGDPNAIGKVTGTIVSALATAGAGKAATSLIQGARSAEAVAAVANPVSGTLARVIPGGLNTTTLGAPGAADVFVTNAAELSGLNATQLANKLTIPGSSTGFQVLEFPTPSSGLASPVFRSNPGFVGGGRTAGGASEFVIPNGPIPAGTVRRVVK